MNGIVLINAILHDPRVAYDAGHHIAYIKTLALDGRLPNPSDSLAYFGPPLPYLLPALFLRALVELRGETHDSWILVGLAWKFAQILNWVFSIGLTVYLVKLCKLIRPDSANLPTLAVFFLALLPVYYKSFAFVRGEPLLTFFIVVSIYGCLKVMFRQDYGVKSALYLGIPLGLALLSRWWVLFVIPSVLLAIFISWPSRSIQNNKGMLRTVLGSVVVAAIVSGWFYVSLLYRTAGGPITQMGPLSPVGNLLSGQPLGLNFSVDPAKLFTQPVRPAFPNHVIAIFYSEMWGDYWGYFMWFSIYGRSISGQTEGVNMYLGRVNLISTLPTLLFLGGIGLGLYGLLAYIFQRERSNTQIGLGLLTLIVISSGLGYLLVLISLPYQWRDTAIKATYMLHAFPFMAILAAELLETICRKNRYLYWSLVAVLIGILLHNLPAMITHHLVRVGPGPYY